MSKKKKQLHKVRVYLNDAEWNALCDIAAANNISAPKCFKVAGVQKLNEIYQEAAARMAAQQPESTDEDTTTIDQPDELRESAPVEAGDAPAVDADVPNDV